MSKTKPTVLIVEDNKDFLENLISAFESFGCEVLSAENGKIALDIVMKTKLTAVLCDIQMPVMSGVEFLDNVRAQGNDVPIIIMTGFSEHDDNEISKRGGTARLQKPFSRAQLKEIVDGYINILNEG